MLLKAFAFLLLATAALFVAELCLSLGVGHIPRDLNGRTGLAPARQQPVEVLFQPVGVGAREV